MLGGKEEARKQIQEKTGTATEIFGEIDTDGDNFID